MTGLDDVWEQLLADAAADPQAVSSESLAAYLAVKSANDSTRETGIRRLFAAMCEVAAHANRQNAGIAIERSENHRFKFGNSMLTGPEIKFRQGVRCLSVEAGWTRLPGDGFMRGGALAAAVISHFGFPRARTELGLFRFEDEARWFSMRDDGHRVSFEIEDLIGHFRTFLD
jgi:hypothetical protein